MPYLVDGLAVGERLRFGDQQSTQFRRGPVSSLPWLEGGEGVRGLWRLLHTIWCQRHENRHWTELLLLLYAWYPDADIWRHRGGPP